MLSFHNNPEIKSALIKRMNKHIELDELIQGETGKNGKGCTVWCALNNGDMEYGYAHSRFEDVLGLPSWLAILQDTIFERLSVDRAKAFSAEWPKAIPVGKDLEPVKWKFLAFILKVNIERVKGLDIPEDGKAMIISAIEGALKLQEQAIESGVWDDNDPARSAAESAAWSAAESAAESAAWSAAWSAARSAAWSAAWSAARSAAWSAAESAARSAAWSAAWSAARSAAESAAYETYADKLIELLKAA